jgi:hypothetical protein
VARFRAPGSRYLYPSQHCLRIGQLFSAVFAGCHVFIHLLPRSFI